MTLSEYVVTPLLLIASTVTGQWTAEQPPKDSPAAAPRAAWQDAYARVQAEEPALEKREARIDAELAALDRAALKDDEWAKTWAGTYYTGDGLGMNVLIKIAPRSGLTYTWHGCMGLYDANHGDIVESGPGWVKVKLAIDPAQTPYGFVSPRVFLVRWGERQYLVPESQMLELVNNYNEGGFPRSEMYGIPLKFEGNPQRTPEPPGRPELPPEYARLVIDKPLRLRFVKVTALPERAVTGMVRALECLLELEGGQDQGVFRGMEVWYRNGRSSGKIVIEKMDATSSEGRLTLFGTGIGDMRPPVVGTELALPGAKDFAAPSGESK